MLVFNRRHKLVDVIIEKLNGNIFISHIFISYSRRDIDFAQKIVTALADNNLDTWIDWKSIPKGEDWEQKNYRRIE